MPSWPNHGMKPYRTLADMTRVSPKKSPPVRDFFLPSRRAVGRNVRPTSEIGAQSSEKGSPAPVFAVWLVWMNSHPPQFGLKMASSHVLHWPPNWRGVEIIFVIKRTASGSCPQPRPRNEIVTWPEPRSRRSWAPPPPPPADALCRRA